MKPLFDAFWRAALYCLHPRVIALSVLPLLLMVGLAYVLGYFFWDVALETVQAQLDSWSVVSTFTSWMEGLGLGLNNLRSKLAPLIVVLVATPALVVVCLLVVAAMMTPAMVSLVAERRFHALERKRGGSFFGGALGALGLTLVAVALIAASVPLWFIPPLILVLPPLIWGWLTYRVLTYDVLADHASRPERQTLRKRHRGPLLAMGVITGYLGAAPSLLWASGALFVAMAPVLIPVAIWIYTLVFAFASLWFSHYALNALNQLRLEALITTGPIERVPVELVPAPPEPVPAPALPAPAPGAGPGSSGWIGGSGS